jgi:hypothetical protein
MRAIEKIDKKTDLHIRVPKSTKIKWKSLCEERRVSLTSLVISSIEMRIMDSERREVMKFIEKQDNIFAKIENNINQIARIVNGQKFMSSRELQGYTEKLGEIQKLKLKQNELIEKIYQILAN